MVSALASGSRALCCVLEHDTLLTQCLSLLRFTNAGTGELIACSAGVFWRGRERVHLIKRAPSWIQTRERLGERRKSVLGSGS